MLIGARETVSAGSASPHGIEVQWIESTGTQYIDSEFIPSANSSFEIEFSVLSSPYTFAPIAYSGESYNSSDTFGISRNSNTKGINCYCDGLVNMHVGDGLANMDDIINVQFRPSNTNKAILVNKTHGAKNTHQFEWTPTYIRGSRSLYIFNGNSSTADLARPTPMRLYFFKFWDKNVLVRDLVPYVDDKGVACLKDYVSNALFYNAGVGKFLAGPEK